MPGEIPASASKAGADEFRQLERIRTMNQKNQRNGKAPRFGIKRFVSNSPSFYKAATGTGTQRVEESWVPDFNNANRDGSQ